MSERYEYAVMARSLRPNMDGSTAYVRVVEGTFWSLKSAQWLLQGHPNPDAVVCKRRVTDWEEVARDEV